MTYKQIEQMREARLWIKDIVVPVIGAAAIVISVPEARTAVGDSIKNAKEYIAQKFKKNKTE